MELKWNAFPNQVNTIFLTSYLAGKTVAFIYLTYETMKLKSTKLIHRNNVMVSLYLSNIF